MQQGQLVEHVGEPLRLLLPVHVEAPDGVVEGLLAHGDLGGHGLFGEVHDGSAESEVLVEVVLPVQSEHGLSLHAVLGVVLVGCLHAGAGVEYALVEDGDLSRRVVHAVVAALLQLHASGRDLDGASWHVEGVERDDVGRRSLELTREQELVFLCNLSRHGLCRVIELVEAVGVGHVAHALALEVSPQVAAEGLCRGEEDTPAADGVAVDVVELSVGVGLHVGVESVQAHHLQQRDALELLFGQVGEVCAGGVALVLDVHAEGRLLHARGEVVDVLHHQVPVGLLRVVAGVLECLDEEAVVGVGHVGGELSHLVGTSAVGILVGHGQHLVGLQSGLQRDESQARVHGVLRRAEQPGAGQLLVVFAALEAVPRLQLGGDGLHRARGGVNDGDERGVLVVGQVRRHVHARWRPAGGVLDASVLAQV